MLGPAQAQATLPGAPCPQRRTAGTSIVHGCRTCVQAGPACFLIGRVASEPHIAQRRKPGRWTCLARPIAIERVRRDIDTCVSFIGSAWSGCRGLGRAAVSAPSAQKTRSKLTRAVASPYHRSAPQTYVAMRCVLADTTSSFREGVRRKWTRSRNPQTCLHPPRNARSAQASASITCLMRVCANPRGPLAPSVRLRTPTVQTPGRGPGMRQPTGSPPSWVKSLYSELESGWID